MVYRLLLASFISLWAVSEATAQTAPASAEIFGGLAGGRTITVVDD